jgi:hypothetical protein
MNSRKLLMSAAAAVLMGLGLSAQAAERTRDAGEADSRIDRTTNWDLTGVPTVGVNTGEVPVRY